MSGNNSRASEKRRWKAEAKEILEEFYRSRKFPLYETIEHSHQLISGYEKINDFSSIKNETGRLIRLYNNIQEYNSLLFSLISESLILTKDIRQLREFSLDAIRKKAQSPLPHFYFTFAEYLLSGESDEQRGSLKKTISGLISEYPQDPVPIDTLNKTLDALMSYEQRLFGYEKGPHRTGSEKPVYLH
ncbi:hypothetical protein JXB31_03180 [Candidatus Woesearchaeota archaeon]|nr:hypothetical protein [Candidatus Woesearchaeota archaeon]